MAPFAIADEPTKQQCIDADTEAQSLRTAEKLIEMRSQLKICSDAACPSIVRDDCAQRMDELDRLQPTLVLSARSGRGKDLIDVHVTMDGQPFTNKLDGAPLPIDPGDHVFTFEVPGETKLTEHFVLRESEKDRRETVTIGKPPPPVHDYRVSDDPNRGRTQRVIGLAVSGVGVIGVAVGAVFGVSAISSWSTAKKECSVTDCPGATRSQAADDRTSAVTKSTVSTIGFIAGGVILAGGVTLFFTAPKSNRPTVGLVPGFGGAALQGTF